jgi:hypothetical protein
VLREHEATAARKAGTRLGQLTQLRGELAFRTSIETKTLNGVIETIRHTRKNGPPITRCSSRGAWGGDRIPLSKEHSIECLGVFMGFVLRDLA